MPLGKFILDCDIVLLGGFSMPLGCLCIVLRDGPTTLIQPIKVVLSCGIATFNSFSIPFDRLRRHFAEHLCRAGTSNRGYLGLWQANLFRQPFDTT